MNHSLGPQREGGTEEEEEEEAFKGEAVHFFLASSKQEVGGVEPRGSRTVSSREASAGLVWPRPPPPRG